MDRARAMGPAVDPVMHRAEALCKPTRRLGAEGTHD